MRSCCTSFREELPIADGPSTVTGHARQPPSPPRAKGRAHWNDSQSSSTDQMAIRLLALVAYGLSSVAAPATAQSPQTEPPTLDLTCHGYDEGNTRAYNCIPLPEQQIHMLTFVPEVGSLCNQGSVQEFPPGRIVFQIRCSDGIDVVPPRPGPTGTVDYEIVNVRRYISNINESDWLLFAWRALRRSSEFSVTVQFQQGTVSDDLPGVVVQPGRRGVRGGSKHSRRLRSRRAVVIGHSCFCRWQGVRRLRHFPTAAPPCWAASCPIGSGPCGAGPLHRGDHDPIPTGGYTWRLVRSTHRLVPEPAGSATNLPAPTT